MNDPTRNAAALSFVRSDEQVAEEVLNTGASPEADPLVEQAARRAAALGLDLDTVLQADAERLTAFPGRECLTPSEVMALVADEAVAHDRAQHALRCEYCASILVAAQPTAEQRERFLDELGSLAGRVRSARGHLDVSSAGS